MRTWILAMLALGAGILGVADTGAADPLLAFVQCMAQVTVTFQTGQDPTVSLAQGCFFTVTP